MRIRNVCFCLLWTALLSGCCGKSDGLTEKDRAAARAIRKIDIYYQYMGWGFRRDHFRIEKGKGDAVSRRWFEVPDDPAPERERGPVESIDSDAIEEFAHDMNSPSIGKGPGIHALFRTISMKGADRDIGTVMGWSQACHERVKREYLRRLRDRKEVLKAMEAIYEREIMWTDDYPSMRILVSYEDGSRTVLESQAQAALMLPWRKNGVETWDYRLADSIARLLPEESMSREFYQTPRARFSRNKLVERAAGTILSKVSRDEFSRPHLCVGI